MKNAVAAPRAACQVFLRDKAPAVLAIASTPGNKRTREEYPERPDNIVLHGIE